jgi:hypothetical protein
MHDDNDDDYVVLDDDHIARIGKDFDWRVYSIVGDEKSLVGVFRTLREARRFLGVNDESALD